MKYSQEKFLYQRITQQKNVCTHEIRTRKSFGSTKFPRENIRDLRSKSTD